MADFRNGFAPDERPRPDPKMRHATEEKSWRYFPDAWPFELTASHHNPVRGQLLSNVTDEQVF